MSIFAVARIPKRTVLSHRTCSLDHSLIASLPSDTPDAFRLAICVLHELLLGCKSRWATYLEHVPRETVPIAILWEGEALHLVKGTELGKELDRIGISRVSATGLGVITLAGAGASTSG